MEQYQELAHHGILGMKWGVRRYQNPDGTLTPAGKKHYEYQNPDGSLTEKGRKEYMKAAKKGKINYKKLSDADLNMINSRFARENQYKKNIEEYEKSTFKYKAKEAVLARLRGNGGNGGGGKKGGGGGGSHKVAQLLLTPISKAFEDAFKFNPNSGNDDGGGGKEEPSGRVGSFISGSMGKKSVSDLVNSNSRISTGKRFMGVTSTRNTDDWGSGWNTSKNTTSESYLYNKHGYKTPQAKNAERYTSNKRKKRAKHDGMEDGIVFVITRSESDIQHFGIKGQKWGVRRFQNLDRTLTAEGKERYGAGREFDKKVKKSEFQNDPELKELYKMEKKELTNGDYRSERKRIAANRPDGLSSKEKLVVDRIQNGEVVDNETVRKIASDHHDEYFALGKKLQVATDETERKEILKQMDDQRRIMDYAYDQIPTLNRENKYEKNLATREDKQSIDPSYRTFSSKAEKAKAEEEYLKNTWYEEDVSKVSGDECQHIFDRVCNLSFNGYDGKPQSDRARSMFDYDPNGYRDYERWVPKYEKSDEWKQIQSERQMLKDKTGYTKAENDFNSASISGAFKTDRKLYDKLSKALSDAQRKYSKRVDASDIKQRERKIEKAFDTEMTKVVLKDLGYEITEANMKYIEGIIWWD